MSIIKLLIAFAIVYPTRRSAEAKLARRFEGFTDEPLDISVDRSFQSLESTLNSLLKHPEFQPLVTAFLQIDSRSQKHELYTRYLQKKFSSHYTFEIDASTLFRLQAGITWIILIENFDFFASVNEKNSLFWRSADRFVIFYIGNEEIRPDRWIEIFQTLWDRRRVCKIVVASIDENFRYIYKFLPFYKIGEEYGIVERLDSKAMSCTSEVEKSTNSTMIMRKMRTLNCGWSSNESTSKHVKLFEDFLDMNDYPLSIMVFPSLMMNIHTNERNETTYTKLDANVMKLVEKRLASKFAIRVLGTGKKMDPFVKGLRTFETDSKLDFIFTGYFTKLYEGTSFEFTSSLSEDQLCLIAPSSEPVPKFFMPFLPFAKDLWFLIIIYNIVAAVFWLFLQRFGYTTVEDNRNRKSVEIAIEVSKYKKLGAENRQNLFWKFEQDSPQAKGDPVSKEAWEKRPVTCQEKIEPPISVYREPSQIHPGLINLFDLSMVTCSLLQGGKTWTERAFLFGTLYFGVVVIGLYQSCLVSSLSKPIYYPQLDTLLDVINSNRTIITKYENLIRDISGDNSPEIAPLRKQLKVFTSNVKTYDMIVNSGAISLGRSSSFKLENLTMYLDKEHNRLLVHMVKECPSTYSLSYITRLHSPYLQRVNSILLRMQQSGLIEKWYNDMLLAVKVAQSPASLKRQPNDRVKLSVNHLSLTFFGLAVGVFCSTLIFIAEYHYAMKSRTVTARLSTRYFTNLHK